MDRGPSVSRPFWETTDTPRSTAIARTISSSDEDALDQVTDVLTGGGVVVMPTDTVYGVMAALSHPPAIERIFRAKERPWDKPLPVLVSGLEQALELARFCKEAMDDAESRWPGPLTLVLERTPEAMAHRLGGDGRTIGLRQPKHGLLIEVIRRVGPIAATSANISGRRSGVLLKDIKADLQDAVDLYVDEGVLGEQPSVVISYVQGRRQLR